MNSRKRRITKLILLKLLINRRRHKYWVHPLCLNRSIDGEHIKLKKMYTKYPDKFKSYTRMNPETFKELLQILGPTLSKKDTNWRKSIPAEIRLFIVLRYLATGDNIRTIATNFSLGEATIWKMIHHGTQVLWNLLKSEYVKVPNTFDWENIVSDFFTKWNMPNCLGAIDGKHVLIQCPPHSGSLYYNYKHSYSIVILATCDANYNFTTIDVGGFGKQCDGGVFAGSSLSKKLNDGSLRIPGKQKLPESNKVLNCFFVGDEAFPMTEHLIRPFPAKGLTTSKRIFNYRLSRARRCIENAFGILVARFQIFKKPINASPKRVEYIVLACVALHNFIKRKESMLDPSNRTYLPEGYGDDSNGLPNGSWRQEGPSVGMLDASSIRSNQPDAIAKKMREELMEYTVNEGFLDWQNERLNLFPYNN